MQKIFKILTILIISLSVMFITPAITSEVSATAVGVLNEVNADSSAGGTYGPEMASVVNRVLGFLQVASALLAVVMIAATGFRYIMETPDMKNELKKSMIPIIVGILLVFFAASIAKFFVGMFADGN